MKTSTYVITLVVVGLVTFSVGFYVFKTYPQIRGGASSTPTPVQDRPCTQDAKLCPDGTSVARTGPNCEFAPCPEQIKFSETCTQDSDCVATCPRDCLNKAAAEMAGGRAACLIKPTHTCGCQQGHCKAN